MNLINKQTNAHIKVGSRVTVNEVTGVVRALRLPAGPDSKGLVFIERDDAPGLWAVTPDRFNAEFR